MKYGKLELGQIEALVNIIGGLENVMKILQGAVKVVLEVVKHLIDCDVAPFCPEGWKVESHKKGGQIEWDPTKVRLYFSPNQQNGKCIQGHNLRKELENEPVLNANVADYLLAHPELMPEDWKGKYVFFWGTIYRDSDGSLCVRYLCWGGSGWSWDYRWLGSVFGGRDPAALSASI